MKQIDILRKRLYYQSHHRGMKEMDLVLGGFAQQHLPEMNQEDLLQFEALLAFPDQDLYGWFFEKAPISENVPGTLIEMINGFMRT
ncbi:MAG: succinate dehydrogenase assembly factor 2 [Alphaproteobacteria bacterium]|nr:succinate dehydrogenase assembly factor 2 [Alphaproteobacteria bacterium]